MVTGQQIKEWRVAKGLQAQFVAQAAGLSKQQFSALESGSRGIDVNEFVAIAKAIGYKPGDLLENSGGVRPDLKPIVEDLERVRPSTLLRVRDLLRLVDEIAVTESASNVVPFPQQERTLPRLTDEFPVDPKDFVEKDFDYPLELHALEVEEFEVAAGATGVNPEIDMAAYTINAKDVRDATHRVIKVCGDSMSPDFEEGWKLLVDTKKRRPKRGDPVAVYLNDEGSVLGYWSPNGDHIELEKANGRYKPVMLGEPGTWHLIGTVQKIVDAPVKRRKK